MKNDNLDHAPIVEDWLKESAWLPPSDTARLTQLVHQTPQQRRWWQRYFTGSPRSMFNVVKLATAGVVLALFGGFLLSGFLPTDGDGPLPPAAETSSPAPATTEPPTEAPSSAPVEPVEVDPTAEPLEAPRAEAELTMDAGSGETVGGFSQIGRLSTKGFPSFNELQDLQSDGARLVARSSIDGANEASGDVILYSDDALTWQTATVPGVGVEILHLAMSDDGLLASGSVRADGQRQGQLWTSVDGSDWTEVSAPPVKRVHQVVLSEDGATLVRSGNQVWLSEDGGEWAVWNKVPDSSILAGPGGILVWQGGGQERSQPTVVLHWGSVHGPLTEVILPRALQWGTAGLDAPDMGIDIFALESEWVMVGSENKAPDQIHVSSNGLDWEDVPRPPEMSQGAVRWIATVGDQTQGFGTLIREDTNPSGIWTWSLGDEAAAADALAGTGDEWMNAPVGWQGGHVATGYERNRDQFLTTWQTQDAAAD